MKPDSSSRRNPWPIALTVFFSLVILSSIGFVIFCTMHNAELVAPDYYEREVRYGDEMARVQRTAALKGAVMLAYDASRKTLSVKVPREHVQSGVSGSVELYRASSSRLDRTLRLATDSDGRQLLSLADLAPGPWEIKLSWKTGDLDYELNQRLIVQPSGKS